MCGSKSSAWVPIAMVKSPHPMCLYQWQEANSPAFTLQEPTRQMLLLGRTMRSVILVVVISMRRQERHWNRSMEMCIGRFIMLISTTSLVAVSTMQSPLPVTSLQIFLTATWHSSVADLSLVICRLARKLLPMRKDAHSENTSVQDMVAPL